MKRTPHGEKRHEAGSRPTREAAEDKSRPSEIYFDLETGYYVFVGERGRTHVFGEDGLHHTSFRTTQKNRLFRVEIGKWQKLRREALPEKLK